MFKFIFVLYISIITIAFTASDIRASTIRIATYNLWNPVFEEKYSGKNTWSTRLPFIIKNITASKSDILCLEEVGKKSYLDLIQNSEINNRYMSFYISHAPSNKGQKEGRDGLAFFYNPEKVCFINLIQSIDGTRPSHRRDFYVDLKLNEARNHPVMFRVACTHVDSEKDLAVGNKQLSSLVEEVLQLDKVKELSFIVVCGDFNEGENESERPRYEIMHNSGFVTDNSIDSTRPEVLNVRHKGHVDWIFFKKLSELDFDLIPVTPIGDEKGSDHKLTMTDVEINS